MLAVGIQVAKEGGDPMRFYTNQHQFYCGIDLHARSMSVCMVSQEGEILLHRNLQAAPEPFLKAMAPYRANLVGAVACLFTGWAKFWPSSGSMTSTMASASPASRIVGRRAASSSVPRHPRANDTGLRARR